MFIRFFLHLKRYQLPVSLQSLLALNEGYAKNVASQSLSGFYDFAKLVMIKDEKHFDKFDVAFSNFVNGLENQEDFFDKEIPRAWLEKQLEKQLTDEEKAKIKALGGLDELLKTFKERLKEQQKRHQGGNKWIGTGGTSPFGAYGYNPMGIRIGQDGSRHQRAIKVWDKREFAGLDEGSALDSRNIGIALKKLYQWEYDERALSFDLKQTIAKTAKKAGFLNVEYSKTKTNHQDVLMLFDIGGSMDFHIKLSKQLFFQAKQIFKNLKIYYFHNCPYESLWQDRARRFEESISTFDVIKKCSANTKLIIVGDASMSPYELLVKGGSVEHMNDEKGITWLKRLIDAFPKMVWLNPLLEESWYAQSIEIISSVIDKKMYPLTISGIAKAMRELS